MAGACARQVGRRWALASPLRAARRETDRERFCCYVPSSLPLFPSWLNRGRPTKPRADRRRLPMVRPAPAPLTHGPPTPHRRAALPRLSLRERTGNAASLTLSSSLSLSLPPNRLSQARSRPRACPHSSWCWSATAARVSWGRERAGACERGQRTPARIDAIGKRRGRKRVTPRACLSTHTHPPHALSPSHAHSQARPPSSSAT